MLGLEEELPEGEVALVAFLEDPELEDLEVEAIGGLDEAKVVLALVLFVDFDDGVDGHLPVLLVPVDLVHHFRELPELLELAVAEVQGLARSVVFIG